MADQDFWAAFEFRYLPSPFPELEKKIEITGNLNFDLLTTVNLDYLDLDYEDLEDANKDHLLGKVSLFHPVSTILCLALKDFIDFKRF